MEIGRENKVKMKVNNLNNLFTLISKTYGLTEKWKLFHATFWSPSEWKWWGERAAYRPQHSESLLASLTAEPGPILGWAATGTPLCALMTSCSERAQSR